MANYTSHAIMSELLYKKLLKKRAFKTKTDIDSLKLFSIGQDLTFFNKVCFNTTHYYNSQKFFINTIKYIYDNNLQYDHDVMTYLYGHIAHYALDITIHPFIGKLTNSIKPKSLITPHTIIECEFDKYLVNKYCKNKKYNYSYLKTKSIQNKNIRNIINNTYRTTYGFIDVNYVYKSTILLIKLCNSTVEYLYYKNNNLFKKLSKIDKYDSEYLFSNYIKNDKKKEFDKILDNSLKLSKNIIKNVNSYLYKNKSENILSLTFDDTPYDVGILENIKPVYNTAPNCEPINE